MNPIIDVEGNLSPPFEARDYTLAYFILSKKPMSEQSLTNTILSLYILFSLISIKNQ